MNQIVKTYSISEIVRAIKGQLEEEFFNITIQGEITNFSSSSAGHYYFNLSDKDASISCALFRGDALRNPLVKKIKEGDKLIASGSISVYLKRGTFQLIAKKISLFGKGDLKAQFEALKKKLGHEGLFDLELKKPIPKWPKKIAIITALNGAALQDFINIMKRRSFGFHITIIPALMQGDGCPRSVLKAFKKAQTLDEVETIVITRGGGAIEDLWGFNDEKLVREIYDSSIPVISAIGHQTDYTLCDFVSDLRCETPSSAAEILSSDQMQMKRDVQLLGKRLRSSALELKGFLENLILKLNPKNSIDHLKSMISEYKHRLEMSSPLKKLDLLGLHQYEQELDGHALEMQRSMTQALEKRQEKITLAHSVLQSMSPFKVLARGYSIVSNDKKQVLTSGKDFDKLNSNEVLNIQFKDGERKVLKKE